MLNFLYQVSKEVLHGEATGGYSDQNDSGFIDNELTVSQAAYKRIQKRLQFFEEHAENLEYTRLGVFFCLLHIPLCWKNHYFCSQFVADLLKSSDEISLKKPAALYLPNHFRLELEKSPYLAQVRYHVV